MVHARITGANLNLRERIGRERIGARRGRARQMCAHMQERVVRVNLRDERLPRLPIDMDSCLRIATWCVLKRPRPARN